MDIFIGLVLLAAAFLVLGYPLYRTRPRTLMSTGGTLNELLAQRDGLYATLRDLDLDYELGKLDAGDYHATREKYLARASFVLQQLDLVRGSNGRQVISNDEIEREVAALRKHPSDRSAPPALVCPNCGRNYNEGDRFCGRCGKTLP